MLKKTMLIVTILALVLPPPIASADSEVIEPEPPGVVEVVEVMVQDDSEKSVEAEAVVENTTTDVSTPPPVDNQPTPVDVNITTPQPTAVNQDLAVADSLLISKVKPDGGDTTVDGVSRGRDEFIEIYNPTDNRYHLTGWSIQSTNSKDEYVDLISFRDEDVIEPGGFVAIRNPHYFQPPQDITLTFQQTHKKGYLLKEGKVRLVNPGGQEKDIVSWTAGQKSGFAIDNPPQTLQRCLAGGGVRLTGTSDGDFKNYLNDEGNEVMQLGQFVACLPDEPENPENPGGEPIDEPVRPAPKNLCRGLVLSEIGSALVEQFVEVKNVSSETIGLKGCRISSQTRGSKDHVFEDLELAAGEELAVEIINSDLKIGKHSGGIFLLDEAGNEVDSYKYEKAKASTSFILYEGDWVLTYHPSLGAANIFQRWQTCEVGKIINELTGNCIKIPALTELTPCGPGQFRNPETGRCKKIEVPKVLAPCKEGQYRSEETGRCRSIALAAARVLKPCADDEFRNPATNRCKKIAADSDVLKECPEGYERNPETRRCRKIRTATIASVDFAPEPVKHVAGATWGWWVFGGVGILAAGYGIWQWRWEIGKIGRRMASVFTAGKK